LSHFFMQNQTYLPGLPLRQITGHGNG
jgi:hypothetical protein